MRMYDIIKKKRDGGELSREEIGFFIRGYTSGEIPDYQASAFCMAVFYRGMTDDETYFLTEAMENSGDKTDLSHFGKKTVDKHSTGGVGDKVTLIVGPIVASLGCVFAKMSGRGLGHTGGTVDKLESIRGYNTALSIEEFKAQIKKVGIAVVGQTGNMVPADKKLYALRDVTATVDSLPLIASSIMSKKLAAGARTIVLDVKVGSGAFMKTPAEARLLAQKMVSIGKKCGRNMAAMITNMDEPLGRNIGNAFEVKEAIDVLCGRGPEDLRTLCVALSAEIVSLSCGISPPVAQLLANDAIDAGKAYDKFREWITAQGGDRSVIENTALLPMAANKREIKAKRNGYLYSMEAEKIGNAAVLLGAGREKKDDKIDMTAGIILKKKVGDNVLKGETLAELYGTNESKFDAAGELFLNAVTLSDDKPEKKPLVYEIIR